MRYAASEKLEIIRTVETSHLPVRRTTSARGLSISTCSGTPQKVVNALSNPENQLS